MRSLLLTLLGVLVLASLAGCRCSEDPAVAELVQTTGVITRDFAGRERAWQPAAPGARFHMGDGVRAAANSRATLALAGDARLHLAAGGTIRFLPHGPKGFLVLDVEVGEAVLETFGQQIRVSSSFGKVVIDPQSRVVMARSDRGLKYRVELGQITLGEEGAEGVAVPAGRGIEVELGGVVLEPFALPGAASASAAPATPGSGAPPESQPIVATTRGNGAQQRAPGVAAWQPLPAGESRLAPGTGVRVDANTAVSVQRGTERAELAQGEFVIGVPGGTLVQATGPVRLTATGGAVTVPGGVIVTKGDDTSAEIQLGADRSARVRVFLGSVDLRGERTEEVRGGETGTLSARGQIEVFGRGPVPANLVVDGGATFTVHDPGPPTVVGFRLGGRCPRGAVVEVSGRTFASQAEPVTASFAVGTGAYGVRCLERLGPSRATVATGTVTVLRASGQQPVAAPAAPTSHVNTDGRRYTVLYQNRLPQVSVGWATAPAAPSYTLVLTGPLSRTVSTSSPQHAFSSGSLPEGTYQVYFEAATNPPRRSRTTSIVLRFDNASPTATIAGPVEVKPGAKVPVTGTALPGWRVFVGDQELPLDGQQRFAGEAVAPVDGSALPIRFEHPARGTHYYLRRTTPP